MNGKLMEKRYQEEINQELILSGKKEQGSFIIPFRSLKQRTVMDYGWQMNQGQK